MSRVYVGNLDSRVIERDLEDEFRAYGVLRSVWVARRPPGYAFIEFDDRRDALDAIRDLDGKNGWRVELSRNSKGGGRGRRGGRGDDMTCYECGEPGHFARECCLRIGPRGMGSGRRQSPSPRYGSYQSRRSPSPNYGSNRHCGSPSPRYRRSPSYGRSYSPRHRSYSPRDRSYSPRGRSYSPRGRSYSRSPSYRSVHNSPCANGDQIQG